MYIKKAQLISTNFNVIVVIKKQSAQFFSSKTTCLASLFQIHTAPESVERIKNAAITSGLLEVKRTGQHLLDNIERSGPLIWHSNIFGCADQWIFIREPKSLRLNRIEQKNWDILRQQQAITYYLRQNLQPLSSK